MGKRQKKSGLKPQTFSQRLTSRILLEPDKYYTIDQSGTTAEITGVEFAIRQQAEEINEKEAEEARKRAETALEQKLTD